MPLLLIHPSKWVRTIRSKLADARARRKLRSLEEQAEDASPSYKPNYYLRAAELAAGLGLEAEALSLYGRAIDGYLEAGRGRAAEALCRKVIDRYPGVVRTRRTLALLAVGRGDDQEAIALLHEYARIARQGGDQRILRQSLRMIALISEATPIRGQAIEELRLIGDTAGVAMVERADELPDAEPFDSAAGTWSQAMQAALLGADRVRNLPI